MSDDATLLLFSGCLWSFFFFMLLFVQHLLEKKKKKKKIIGNLTLNLKFLTFLFFLLLLSGVYFLTGIDIKGSCCFFLTYFYSFLAMFLGIKVKEVLHILASALTFVFVHGFNVFYTLTWLFVPTTSLVNAILDTMQYKIIRTCD